MRRGYALVFLLGVAAMPATAQEDPDGPEMNAPWTADMVPVDPFAARVPFGPGEHLVYKVKVGIFSVGYGYMSVLGTEDVRDNPSYRVEMGIAGGLGPLTVDDTYKSWVDVSTFQSWRFIQDIHDPGYHSYRHYEFFPERRTWEMQDRDEIGTLGSALPMDDIAFIYYIRSMPLEVGKSYTINRYFKETGNPVVIEVLRKDQREVDGVLYNTIVVKPLIRTSGLFGQGGDAELHFSDDERRILVYLKSNIPKFPGSLTLHLETIQDGFPLNPESRVEALEARRARAEERATGR